MGIKKKVLIAYENRNDVLGIVKFLKDEDYDVFITSSGREAIGLVESHCPDILLLGSVLADGDGLKVLRSLREWSVIPVIVISASGDDSLMLEALDIGADDYINDLCSNVQLLLRMKVAIRRYFAANHPCGSGDCYDIGSMRIDCNECRVFMDGRDVHLTRNEFRIVALLAKNLGNVCSYDYILTQLWGPNSYDGNQILRVNITKIRKKLGDSYTRPRYIFTQPGVGYRLMG